jgi:hypothetical protein
VPDLGGEAAGGTAGGWSQGGAEERHCGFGWHFGRVCLFVGLCLDVDGKIARSSIVLRTASQRGGGLDAEMQSVTWSLAMRLDTCTYM